MKIEPFFRWYDLRIGVYIDLDNAVLYVCPLPMLGVKVSFGVWEEIGYALSTLNAFPWLSETWTDEEIIRKLEYVSWDGVWWDAWVETGPLPQNSDKLGRLTRSNLDQAIANLQNLQHIIKDTPPTVTEINIPARPDIQEEMKQQGWIDQKGNLTPKGTIKLFHGE